MPDYERLSEHLEAGRAEDVVAMVKTALEDGADPQDILDNGLIKAMSAVGVKFKKGEIFIPEVLIAARAMTKGIEILEPRLMASGVKAKGKLVIGTVKDDLHDIGKNLVAIMFKGAGFEVIDLGVNVTPEKFVEAVRKHQPDVVGMSALLTTTMVNMKGTIQALRQNGVESKVIIGGAPVSQSYADSIEADFYAHNAVEGVDKILEFIEQ